jgi:hypothetical protein
VTSDRLSDDQSPSIKTPFQLKAGDQPKPKASRHQQQIRMKNQKGQREAQEKKNVG